MSCAEFYKSNQTYRESNQEDNHEGKKKGPRKS